MFQIVWSIAIDIISHGKRECCLFSVNVYCIFPSMDEDKY